jgi:hypothetical protein
MGEDGGEAEFDRGDLPFSSRVPLLRDLLVVDGEFRGGVSSVTLVGLDHRSGGDLAADVRGFFGTWGGSLTGTIGGDSPCGVSTSVIGPSRDPEKDMLPVLDLSSLYTTR